MKFTTRVKRGWQAFMGEKGHSFAAGWDVFNDILGDGILGGYGYDDSKYLNAQVEHIDSCTDLIAQGVAKTPLRVYVSKASKTPTKNFKTRPANSRKMLLSSSVKTKIAESVAIEEITDLSHPLKHLVQTVNDIDTRYNFMVMLVEQFDLTGDAFVLVEFRNILGARIPIALYPTIPSNMKINLDEKKEKITGYEYRVGTRKIPLSPEEVLHFKRQSGSNLVRGRGVLEGIIDTVNTDNFMRRYEKAMFKNFGVPSGVLMFDEEMNQEDIDNVERKFHSKFGGMDHTGKFAVLDKHAKLEIISQTLKDLNHQEGRKITRDSIASAFHVPVALLAGEKVIYTGKGLQAANTQLAEQAIAPRLIQIEEVLNKRLCPWFGDNVFLAFDSPIPGDAEIERETYTAYVQAGIMTRNEVRAEIGLDPMEGGDELQINQAPQQLLTEGVKKKPSLTETKIVRPYGNNTTP